MNYQNIKYCCLKCEKDIHIFNNDMLYCIHCGNADIDIVCQLECTGCLATYTIIQKVNQNIDYDKYICPSCVYIIKNMGPSKHIIRQA